MIVTNPAVFFPQQTEEERKFIGGRKTPTATRQDWLDKEHAAKQTKQTTLATGLGLFELLDELDAQAKS